MTRGGALLCHRVGTERTSSFAQALLRRIEGQVVYNAPAGRSKRRWRFGARGHARAGVNTEPNTALHPTAARECARPRVSAIVDMTSKVKFNDTPSDAVFDAAERVGSGKRRGQ